MVVKPEPIKTPDKPLYNSKTVWGGVLLGLGIALGPVLSHYGIDFPLNAVLDGVGVMLGITGIRAKLGAL